MRPVDSETPPIVGVIMGSLSDLPALEAGLDLFKSWGLPYEVLVASAHRTPARVMEWASTAEARGLEVIIAAAGGAAHLPGVVAAHSLLPVIGMPVDSSPINGIDSLYSIVQMPPGIPVATVGIDTSINAAVLALEILARADARWRETLREYRAGWSSKVDKQNVELREKRPEAAWTPHAKSAAPRSARTEKPPQVLDEEAEAADVRPVDLSRPLEAPAKPATRPARPIPATPTLARVSRYLGRVTVESDLMPVELVEAAIEILMEGGVIALPTDTVYGLAVDATNKEAVERLYSLKGREDGRAIAALVDSQRLLASLVLNLSVDIRRVLEAFWPGPLTVIFDRRGDEFAHLSPEPTIGVRLPDHSIPLTLIQELRRPIACTSANPSGREPARSAREVEEYFGRNVNLILDAGTLPHRLPSTVLDVTRVPFAIKREGLISREQLAAVAGHLIDDDDDENDEEENDR